MSTLIDDLANSLTASRRQYVTLLAAYQELAAAHTLAVEAAASAAEREAIRLMEHDHAAGRGLDGCCVQTATRITAAIREGDKPDARARRDAAARDSATRIEAALESARREGAATPAEAS